MRFQYLFLGLSWIQNIWLLLLMIRIGKILGKIHPNTKCQPILPKTEISDQNLSPSKVLLHFFNQNHISLMYLNSWRWIFLAGLRIVSSAGENLIRIGWSWNVKKKKSVRCWSGKSLRNKNRLMLYVIL